MVDARRLAHGLLLATALLAGCGPSGERDERTTSSSAGEAPDPRPAALERLRVVENARRVILATPARPPADEASGPDPIAIATLPGRPELVGLLRGRSAAVLLDVGDALREVDRVAAPAAPSGLAVATGGDVFVSGELGDRIGRYRVHDGRLIPGEPIPLGDVRSVRALAAGPEGVLYAAEDHDHRLLVYDLARPTAPPVALGGLGLGPRLLLRTPGHLLAAFTLSHAVVVLPVDARGVPRADAAVRIEHDGPIWAVDARETPAGLLIALGGVEDHPLDRRQGSFGYVDSFIFVYRAAPAAARADRLAAVNVSALGVVTPKVVRLDLPGRDVVVRVTGYGAPGAAVVRWTDPHPTRRGLWPQPAATTRALVPGIAAEASFGDHRQAYADPLLDAWVLDDGRTPQVVPVPDPGRPPRDVEARLGEALLFTTLMAPWNRTRGSLSRFTCETCHLDGVVDGRVHHTGRGDVRVATRPLQGIASVRPYFSRGLDPDLTAMVHNEFRVAGMRSRHDSWFALGVAEAPWLAHLGVGGGPLSPEALRRALLVFLLGFDHQPNPSALRETAWTSEQQRGAEVFRDRCESCHQARLLADRPETRVPFEAWERLVLVHDGPIVWARDTRERTGVEPYVHPDGARVPSLRRLYRKRPYFTNGSAPALEALLAQVRVDGDGFHHAGGHGPPALDDADRHALAAFLDTL